MSQKPFFDFIFKQNEVTPYFPVDRLVDLLELDESSVEIQIGLLKEIDFQVFAKEVGESLDVLVMSTSYGIDQAVARAFKIAPCYNPGGLLL